MNNGKRTSLQFDRSKLKDMLLEDALKNPNMARFVRQLTGLRNPKVLAEIGKHFGKEAGVWTSSSNEARAAWLGCDGDDFSLGAYGYLNSDDAARGVSSSS